MIKLYRKEDSETADAIEAEFRELVGYDRVVVAEQDAKQLLGEEASFPAITNNENVVSGEQIPAYLQELRVLARDWQRFQGDFCTWTMTEKPVEIHLTSRPPAAQPAAFVFASFRWLRRAARRAAGPG